MPLTPALVTSWPSVCPRVSAPKLLPARGPHSAPEFFLWPAFYNADDGEDTENGTRGFGARVSKSHAMLMEFLEGARCHCIPLFWFKKWLRGEGTYSRTPRSVFQSWREAVDGPGVATPGLDKDHNDL